MFGRSRRPGPPTRNRLAPFVDEQNRISSALVEIGEIFADHEAIGVKPGAVADSIARIGRLVVVGGIALHTQVRAPRLISLPHGGRQILANPIRASQAPQIAGFTLGARNKKTHARGWGAGAVNNPVHTAASNNR